MLGAILSRELDALGYLQAVYQGKVIVEGTRMKAAIEALPFERPKLAVTASFGMDKESFAAQMQEIARKSGRSNVIDAKPSTLIDVRKTTEPESL
jgi:hypothetical protein